MNPQTGLLRWARRTVTFLGLTAPLKRSSIAREYSPLISHRTKKNRNNWKYAAGATVAIAGIIVVSKPWQMHRKQSAAAAPNNATDVNHPRAPQSGLEQNTEPTSGNHKPSQTTGANTQKGNSIETYPDAKGGNKRRITSKAGMKQGTAEKAPANGYEGVHDKVAASKPPGGRASISGKQEGISNSDTRYSIDLTNNPNKSVKGEGTPETSKSKGTVDVRRPLVP